MGPLPGDASDLSFVLAVAPAGPIATKADNPTLPTQPHESAEAVRNAYNPVRLSYPMGRAARSANTADQWSRSAAVPMNSPR